MLKHIGLTLAALVIALPAAAQTACVAERGDVIKQLSAQYNEKPRRHGTRPERECFGGIGREDGHLDNSHDPARWCFMCRRRG